MQTIQIDLFAELPPGCRVKQKRARRGGKPLLEQLNRQLSFDLSARVDVQPEDEEEDQFVLAPIVHRIVSARDAAPMAIKGPASVWDMAFAPIAIKTVKQDGKRSVVHVERGEGLVRCIKVQECETTEWKEREASRRAKQRLPKPNSGYKTMSAKFKALME